MVEKLPIHPPALLDVVSMPSSTLFLVVAAAAAAVVVGKTLPLSPDLRGEAPPDVVVVFEPMIPLVPPSEVGVTALSRSQWGEEAVVPQNNCHQHYPLLRPFS